MRYGPVLQKINYIAVLLLVFFLPFSSQMITYLIGLWTLSWILEGNFSLKINKLKSYKFWLISSLILISIISIFYSTNKSNGLNTLQTQISLVLLPLIWVTSNNILKKKKNLILISYLIGIFVFSLYLIYTNIILKREIYSLNEFDISNILKIANRFSSETGHRSYLSLHLSLGIVFCFYLFSLVKNNIYYKISFIGLICLFSFTILILNSRAAFIILIILISYYLFKLIKNEKRLIRYSIIVILLTGFGYLVLQSRLKQNINWLFNSISEKTDPANLYSNGNFENGINNWKQIAPDSIYYELIDTKYGKAIRVERKDGEGWWSVAYKGREILYYKDLTYKFQFKLRIIKGDKIPFNIGWWVKEKGKYKNNLKVNTVPIENGWLQCRAEYTFIEDHQKLISLINTQLPNTIFDITDIKLTCNDTLGRYMFMDQIEDVRISIWRNALLVIREKPLFGYGIGDSKKILLEVHQKKESKEALDEKYNCHNQFLETTTQTGLIGLIVILLVFAIPLYQSIKKKQELLFLFLVICFVNFLFESMLERLAGVVFFAFWYSFLWFVYYKDENKSEEITSSSNQK